MQSIQLNTGDKMPMFGLGTWQSEAADIKEAIKASLGLGYRHFDCAAIYANEAFLGETFEAALAHQGLSREALWLTSKLWNSFHAPEDVEPALKQTLKDLKTDYLDLYLIHWPLAFARSVGTGHPETAGDIPEAQVPLEETWQAMEACVKKGLVKNIGVSNFSISKTEHILQHCTIKPAVNQVECHIYNSQFELVEFCQKNQIEVTAYSPLGSPGLPDGVATIDDSFMPPLENELVEAIAGRLRATPAQVLLAWLLVRNIIVIPKSTNPQRIQENWAAQNIKLTSADIDSLNQLNRNFRYVDASFWEVDESSWFEKDYIWK